MRYYLERVLRDMGGISQAKTISCRVAAVGLHGMRSFSQLQLAKRRLTSQFTMGEVFYSQFCELFCLQLSFFACSPMHFLTVSKKAPTVSKKLKL